MYKDACKMIEKVKEVEKFGDKFKTDFAPFKAFVSNKGKGEFKCICTKNGDKVSYKFEYTSKDTKKEVKKDAKSSSDEEKPENVEILTGYDAVAKFIEVYKSVLGEILGDSSSKSHSMVSSPKKTGLQRKLTNEQALIAIENKITTDDYVTVSKSSRNVTLKAKRKAQITVGLGTFSGDVPTSVRLVVHGEQYILSDRQDDGDIVTYKLPN